MLDIIGKSTETSVIGNHEGLNGKIIFHDKSGTVKLPSVNGNLHIEVWKEGSVSGNIDISGLRRFGNIRIFSKNGGSVKIAPMTTIEQCYFLADGENITLGEDCMVSFGISFRTTDAHGIYDIQSGDRINHNAAISIESHVWIGQGCTIAKGTTVEMSSVIGAFSFTSNGLYERNAVYAGTPARKIKDNITWDRQQCENIFDEGASVDSYFQNNLDMLIGKT